MDSLVLISAAGLRGIAAFDGGGAGSGAAAGHRRSPRRPAQAARPARAAAGRRGRLRRRDARAVGGSLHRRRQREVHRAFHRVDHRRRFRLLRRKRRRLLQPPLAREAGPANPLGAAAGAVGLLRRSDRRLRLPDRVGLAGRSVDGLLAGRLHQRPESHRRHGRSGVDRRAFDRRHAGRDRRQPRPGSRGPDGHRVDVLR